MATRTIHPPVSAPEAPRVNVPYFLNCTSITLHGKVRPLAPDRQKATYSLWLPDWPVPLNLVEAEIPGVAQEYGFATYFGGYLYDTRLYYIGEDERSRGRVKKFETALQETNELIANALNGPERVEVPVEIKTVDWWLTFKLVIYAIAATYAAAMISFFLITRLPGG